MARITLPSGRKDMYIKLPSQACSVMHTTQDAGAPKFFGKPKAIGLARITKARKSARSEVFYTAKIGYRAHMAPDGVREEVSTGKIVDFCL